jgi:anti-anti-sigma factor
MATADEFDVNTVTLSGPVTVNESSEVRETLAAALAEGRPLRLDLEASGPWDLAGLQLLISAAATARKAGGSLRLAQVPGVCREVAERSGLGAWMDQAAESFH